LGDLWTRSQSQSQSVASLVAVEGALSPSFSSRSSSMVWLDIELVADLVLVLELPVDVRLSGALPVRGGLAIPGDGIEGLARDMDLRKSM
jgi:hypothetical protein